MDSKTLKSTLKQAKEAIKNKDISSGLSLCKAVLKEDRNNYIALVLLGAAFQESDQKNQAPNAYRKAIEVSPDQLLAWQGLMVFYEKDDANKHAEELVPIYQRFLQFESETSKWCDTILKIQMIITKFKSDDSIRQILIEYKNTDDSVKLDALRKLVVHYLSHVDDIPAQNLKLCEEVLNGSDSDFENDHCQACFKLLYNQKKMQQLLTYADKLIQMRNENCQALEWICKVSSELYVEDRSSVEDWCDRLPQYYTSLQELSNDNVLGLMSRGVHLMSQRAYLEARETLQYCLSLNRGLFHAVCLLAETELQLLCLEQAERHARTALSLRPDHRITRAILAKTLALSDDPGKWEKAVNMAKELLVEGPCELAAEALCQAYLQLQQWSDLLTALPCLSHAPALAALLHLECEHQGAGEGLLLTLAQHTPDCPEAWYLIGQLHNAECSYDLACTAFLKCAKLAPHWYTAYLQLGHIYARSNVTLDKARRCYQRALALNPAHSPTQMALSDIYRALGDGKSNLSLLEDISQRPEGHWAWARLGLQYWDLGDTSAAINCLRAALKSDPDNSHMWEALADAYMARGANGSALKSYQKVLELKPGAFYPALQIATIKQMTELADESLLEFRELVVAQPASPLVLKGLCETCLYLAREHLTTRLMGLSRDRLQEGLTAIASAVQVRPDLACLWKLAGDCLTLAGSLPRSWHYLTVPEVLRSKSASEAIQQGLQLLQLGARCLCRCLKLMSGEGQAAVWHDLGLNYRQQAELSDTRDSICQRALAAAKESVTLDPGSWQHWNQLGIVAALPEVRKFKLAQHAFIKATMLDNTVAAPWSNLGCLYLRLDELKLANAAFSAAQRTDSEYCPSWVGQALIAERVQNEETMDLFRHTTQLGYHPESSLGYGQWVCQTLRQATNDPHYIYSIERMHAVPLAIDALTWSTDDREDDACGLNMLGCLLERCGRYRSSVEVLSRAVDQAPPTHRDKVLANFGRVLLKAEKVEDSVQVYQAISKADIHTQCGLALALYRGKQYQEAFEAYEAALNWWAQDDAVKAHLHVAMAAVAYKLAGADLAKTLLLKGNQLKPTSVYGLFAACSLGMLNSDLELSKTVLRDLLKYQNEAEYISHIALFQAYTKFLQCDFQGSVWSMSKTVHVHPSLPALWLHLALLILNKHSVGESAGVVGADKVGVAAHSARTAMTLGRTKMDVSKVLAVVSLSQLMSGDANLALSASQHAVHLYPAVGESWAVLATSCHAASVTAVTPAHLRSFISHARQNIELERPLAKWMSNFERKISLLAA